MAKISTVTFTIWSDNYMLNFSLSPNHAPKNPWKIQHYQTVAKIKLYPWPIPILMLTAGIP